MPYWQLFYHIVWSTKNREPLLTPEIEPMVYGYIKSKAIGLEGVLFALNGVADHLHLVVSIPPKIAVSTFIGQVKGVTSTKFNKSGIRDQSLFWQEEYGVFSFDRKRLANIVAYVEHQKEHHAQGELIPVLERTDDAGVRLSRELPVSYASDNEWWREMLALDDGAGSSNARR